MANALRLEILEILRRHSDTGIRRDDHDWWVNRLRLALRETYEEDAPTAPSYFGRVTHSEFDVGGELTVADDKWPDVPAEGWEVEVRLLRRSPYWSLVGEDRVKS